MPLFRDGNGAGTPYPTPRPRSPAGTGINPPGPGQYPVNTRLNPLSGLYPVTAPIYDFFATIYIYI